MHDTGPKSSALQIRSFEIVLSVPLKSCNKYGFTRDKAERKNLTELQMIWEGGEPGDLDQEYS